jgi:hypothetical protein
MRGQYIHDSHFALPGFTQLHATNRGRNACMCASQKGCTKEDAHKARHAPVVPLGDDLLLRVSMYCGQPGPCGQSLGANETGEGERQRTGLRIWEIPGAHAEVCWENDYAAPDGEEEEQLGAKCHDAEEHGRVHACQLDDLLLGVSIDCGEPGPCGQPLRATLLRHSPIPGQTGRRVRVMYNSDMLQGLT